MRLDRTGRAYLIARAHGTQIDIVEGEAAVVDEVGFVVRQPELSTILREESQLYGQLILTSTQGTSRARCRSCGATHLAGSGSSRLRTPLTELLLNDLRRANLRDEGVARFDATQSLSGVGISKPSASSTQAVSAVMRATRPPPTVLRKRTWLPTCTLLGLCIEERYRRNEGAP